MKKKVFGFFAAVALIATVSVVANAQKEADYEILHEMCNTHAEGKHCNYSVGCSCPGFSPITDGTVAQESYCKHCGHHKKYHH